MSFASFKNKKANLEKLRAQNESNDGGGRDERFWRLGYDRDTFIGSALIRVLPRYDADGEITLPWVSWKEFSFKGKTKSYYNRSLVSIGKPDPVAELNKAHWDNMSQAQKDGTEGKEARKRNVKMRYVANIVVVDDPAHPENNGKVFLFKFGNQIKKILEKAWFPEYEDQTPVVFFDWDEGANLRMRSKRADFGKMPTYEDSSVEVVSPLFGGDQSKQEEVYNNLIDLSEFEAESNYKSYDELKSELIKVLGARYVSGILGEEYSPEQVAASGGNPFDMQQAQQAQQAQNDQKPQEQHQAQNAVQSQPQETSSDPFKNAEQTTQEQADPFKESAAEGDDPFANLNID